MGAMCPENLVVQNNKGLTLRFTDEGNKKSLFVTNLSKTISDVVRSQTVMFTETPCIMKIMFVLVYAFNYMFSFVDE